VTIPSLFVSERPHDEIKPSIRFNSATAVKFPPSTPASIALSATNHIYFALTTLNKTSFSVIEESKVPEATGLPQLIPSELT
jgi:hypothetical protein